MLRVEFHTLHHSLIVLTSLHDSADLAGDILEGGRRVSDKLCRVGKVQTMIQGDALAGLDHFVGASQYCHSDT